MQQTKSNVKSRYRNGQKQKFDSSHEFPPLLRDQPEETRTAILSALKVLVPVFIKGKPNASGAMLAAVMRITGVYEKANDDDVSNVLLTLRPRTIFKNGKCFFELASVPVAITQTEGRGEG